MEKALERKTDGNTGNPEAGTSGTEQIENRSQKCEQGEKSGRKLILIEPTSPGKHIYSAMKLPRLGAILLGTIARQAGWEVRVYVEDIDEVDYADVLTADLVGISTITSTANRSYAIADAIREFGVPVVMGGPHVTFLASEALEHCDFVVRGEGEKALPALMSALFSNKDYRNIPNLSYREEDGTVLHNDMSEFIEDLDSLPNPDFNLIVGWKQAKGFGSKPILPILTSRGCPFGCTFCSVIGMFGRKMRFRSVDNVIGEIEAGSTPDTHIFFYDDNFTGNKKRAKALLRKIGSRESILSNWSAQVRTDVAKDQELMNLMRDTNCSHVYVGFESVNPEALKEMKKKQELQDMQKAVSVFKRHGINMHGMFVYGFESDTKQSLDQTLQFAIKSNLLSAQFLLLTPLPGTPLFDSLKEQQRISTTDWSHFDAHHVVYTPRNIGPWDLQRAQMKAHDRFYSKWRTLQHLTGGHFTDGLLYLYARNLNKHWKKANNIYLKALKIAKKAKGLSVYFDFEIDLSEVKRKVREAAEGLAIKGIPVGAPAY